MSGYICVRENGEVLGFGDTPAPVSGMAAIEDRAVAITMAPDGSGYWVATRSGQVVARGVPDLVGPTGVPSSCDVVDLVATSTGRGLWVLDAVGGIFCFGDAKFHGSVPGLQLDAQIHAVGLAATAGDGGYWVLDRVGGVFCFGDAMFYGSVPGLNVPSAPAVELLPEPSSDGYIIVTEDGANHAFGRVVEIDVVTARHPIVAATRTRSGALLVDAMGIVYPLGMAPFLGTPATASSPALIADLAWCEGHVNA